MLPQLKSQHIFYFFYGLLALVGLYLLVNGLIGKIIKENAFAGDKKWESYVIDTLEQSVERQNKVNEYYRLEIKSLKTKLDSIQVVILSNEKKLQEIQKRKDNEKIAIYNNWSDNELTMFLTARYNHNKP